MGISAQNPETMRHEWNQDQFQIAMYMIDVHTGLPCRVEDVFPLPPGEVKTHPEGLAGFVHVKLAIEQFDNNDPPKTIVGPIVQNVPYFRYQGGTCAVVIDPEIGDWGWITFGERDISKWKRTKKIEIPPTRRMHSRADGGYLPGIINTPPEIYIRIHKTGITIEGKDQPITAITTGDASVECAKATVKASTYCHIDTPVQAESCMTYYIQPGRVTHPYPEFQP